VIDEPRPEKAPTRPADPLSILSLATGIAAVLLALVSVMPLVGMCALPISALCVLTSVISGVASLIRTAVKPELDGRYQALAGLGLCLLWGAAAAILAVFASRAH
jgi:hypothetical protein